MTVTLRTLRKARFERLVEAVDPASPHHREEALHAAAVAELSYQMESWRWILLAHQVREGRPAS